MYKNIVYSGKDSKGQSLMINRSIDRNLLGIY
jgi:hypothetical protein